MATIGQREKLIAIALAGEPPREIAEELREICSSKRTFKDIWDCVVPLNYHLMRFSCPSREMRPVTGMAQSDQVVGRVEVSEKLIFRTIERKLGRPFREAGPAGKEITRNFELYISVPRAGSFAMTLRLGLPQKQLVLPIIERDILQRPGEIIDTLLECLESFDNDQKGLEDLIPDPTYRRNFVALARKLAPDGDRVKVVGLDKGYAKAKKES